MNLNNSNNAAAPAPLGRALLAAKYNVARSNLLLVFAFTIVNILLNFVNAGFYLLFSASLPYDIVDSALYETGHYPAEYYADFVDFEPAPAAVLYICVVIAAIIMLFYLLAYLFSKNGRYGWMIAALVFFSIDCLILLYDTVSLVSAIGASGLVNNILDIAVHAWVLYYLIMGVSNGVKLSKAPAEEEAAAAADIYTPSVGNIPTEIPASSEGETEAKAPEQQNADEIVFSEEPRNNDGDNGGNE